MTAVDESKPLVRQATIKDCEDLAPRLRAADVMEIEAANQTPLEALTNAVKLSEKPLAIEYRGSVVAMCGAVPVGAAAMPWFLGSPEVSRISVFFLREAKAYLKRLRKRFAYLSNVVDVRNSMHLRWIKRCGFRIIGEPTINGTKFLQFYMKGT